jgi:hypothetical protein
MELKGKWNCPVVLYHGFAGEMGDARVRANKTDLGLQAIKRRCFGLDLRWIKSCVGGATGIEPKTRIRRDCRTNTPTFL